MKTFWRKVKNYFTSPMFTPTIDRFIGVGSAFIGAFIGVYFSDQMPQLLVILLILVVILSPILRLAGKKWRQKKGIDAQKLKPHIRAERSLLNAFVVISITLLLFAVIVNIFNDTFNWAWIGFHVFLVLWCILWRFIHIRRLKKKHSVM